jgi:hypothetical protein
MKLKIYLLTMFLFGMGIFGIAQKPSSKTNEKPTVENGRDAIPITVTSTKKAKKKKAPTKIEVTKYEASKSVKEKTPPPPPPLPRPKKN